MLAWYGRDSINSGFSELSRSLNINDTKDNLKSGKHQLLEKFRQKTLNNDMRDPRLKINDIDLNLNRNESNYYNQNAMRTPMPIDANMINHHIRNNTIDHTILNSNTKSRNQLSRNHLTLSPTASKSPSTIIISLSMKKDKSQRRTVLSKYPDQDSIQRHSLKDLGVNLFSQKKQVGNIKLSKIENSKVRTKGLEQLLEVKREKSLLNIFKVNPQESPK